MRWGSISLHHPAAAECMNESTLRIGVVQCELTGSPKDNVDRIASLVREAAEKGAQIVVTPELFETRYFPQSMDEAARKLALPIREHAVLQRMQALASELGVVLPISFFELEDTSRFNSLIVFDGDGAPLGVYRKSHIPEGPGYEEKFYFSPGNTGFRVWETRYGRLGTGICWDQWFPEAARAMALAGAEVLIYPTAIGTEPATPDEDSRDPWRRVMIGHAVANAVPVAAANRTGREDELVFYGSSFVCDHRGEVIAELGRDDAGIAIAAIDRDALRRYRANWDFFSDRRPDLYASLTRDENE